HGLTQVMVRRFDPAQVLRLIQDEKATSMSLVPTMANALLNCGDVGKWDVSSMRTILLGGAASSPEQIARMEAIFPPPAMVAVGYGLTESAPVATSSRDKSTVRFADEADRLRHRAMAGWPLPGCEVRVVDLAMNDVPRDMRTFGEIVMRGDWMHTGDMAVWDEENYIQIVDRQKDIIISGGENISSIEVERAIAAHPAVLECAVVSAPDPQWGEVVAAFVVVKPGHTLEQLALCDFLQQRIAKFKMPRRFQIGETALPKTGPGKIATREFARPFLPPFRFSPCPFCWAWCASRPGWRPSPASAPPSWWPRVSTTCPWECSP